MGTVLRVVRAIGAAAFTGLWAAAQTPVPDTQRIIHESWTFRDGAPESIQGLAQTADGYLWLGTPSGLFRFDGVRFELFRAGDGNLLPSTNVSALFAPPTGGLWIGYRFGGFSILKNGKLSNFRMPSAPGLVRCFAQDRHGIMWAATTDGVWRFDGASWQQNPSAWIRGLPGAQLGFDRDGILWALTEEHVDRSGRQLFYLLPDGKTFQKAADHFFGMGFTRDANLTVLTTHEKSPGEPGSGIVWEDALPAYPILKNNSDQILDRSNGIWLIPKDPFVLRHPAGEPLPEIVGKTSRSTSLVFDINPVRYSRLVDREGSIWMGASTGLHRFSYSPLIDPQLPKTGSTFFTMAPDEGGVVWISAGSGGGSSVLYRVAGGEPEFRGTQGGLALLAYRAPDKTLWFGGEGGLAHMVNGRLQKFRLPPEVAAKALSPLTMTQERSGAIYVSFGGAGIHRLKDGIWTRFRDRTSVIAFTDDVGRVWFGFTSNGIEVLDGARVQAFGPADGLQVGNVTAINGRGSDIWVGGEFGLAHFEQGRFRAIQSVSRESLRGISGIIETANGDLWLNGLGGIIHLGRAEIAEALKNPAYEVQGERLGRRQGLPGLPSQLGKMPTAIEGSDGRLWFTGYNGVVWLDPARASKKLPPAPVTIQSVSGDDRSYDADSSIRFPAHTSSVQISYAAVSLSDPEAVRFRYKLDETDKKWRESATSNSVNFRNLPPGLYHFVVNASDTNGLWSGNTATVEFTVLPAFYQTIWFPALLTGVILAILWAGYRLRIGQLKRVRQLEADLAHTNRVSMMGELAASIAHEVNQPLTGIVSNGSASLRWLSGDTPNLEEAREAIRDIVRDGKRAGDVIARIRALTKRAELPKEKLDVNETTREVLALVGDQAKKNSVTIRTEFAEEVWSVLGDRVQLQQVLLNLVMNAMEAMTGSGERERQLSITTRNIDPDQVQVSVQDSGVGLDPNAMPRIFESFYTTKSGGMGMGLSISRSILQNHGGRLWATPNDGLGTTFHFTLPKYQAEEQSISRAI